MNNHLEMNHHGRYKEAVMNVRDALMESIKPQVDHMLLTAPQNGTESELRAKYLDEVVLPIWEQIIALTGKASPGAAAPVHLKHQIKMLRNTYGPRAEVSSDHHAQVM